VTFGGKIREGEEKKNVKREERTKVIEK
jgi:hypothetical protein